MTHFFHFQGAHFFHATLMLMHETPKIRKKKLTAVYETQVTREINMSQEEGGRHSRIKEWFK